MDDTFRRRQSDKGVGGKIASWHANYSRLIDFIWLFFVTLGVTVAIFLVVKDENHRVADLRASCLRTSVRIAADMNLNWLYYQSEILLSKPVPPSVVKRALAPLSRGERQFVRILLSQGQSEKILRARADADYQATLAKSNAVDVRDVNLITLRTPLGSGAVPRLWVLEANFSCERAYP